jgi:Zn-dependent peptidase ImmA (M78 family)
VDEELMEKRYINRYRFTLAHEVGHKWLHADFIRSLNCSSVANWRTAMASISKETYGWLEWHANCFASFVLMPPEAFDEELTRLKLTGCSSGIASKIASRFEVSPKSVELRLKHLAAAII